MGRCDTAKSHLESSPLVPWVSLLTFCLETQTRNAKRERVTTGKRRKLKKLLCVGSELIWWGSSTTTPYAYLYQGSQYHTRDCIGL